VVALGSEMYSEWEVEILKQVQDVSYFAATVSRQLPKRFENSSEPVYGRKI
jgi:hypothetical protein